MRNRLKVGSSVANAAAFLAVQKEFGVRRVHLELRRRQGCCRIAGSRRKDVPARTAESDAMSKDLKKRGFRFVGSTICYAFMQATGMVNDHLVTCFRHRELA